MSDLIEKLEALVEEWEKDYETLEDMSIETAARQLRSLLASEKARGPDPLLVQAREALGLTRQFNHTPGNKGPCELCKKIDPVLAALDARLGGGT